MDFFAEGIDFERLLVHLDRLAEIAAGAGAFAERDQRFKIILVEHFAVIGHPFAFKLG